MDIKISVNEVRLPFVLVAWKYCRIHSCSKPSGCSKNLFFAVIRVLNGTVRGYYWRFIGKIDVKWVAQKITFLRRITVGTCHIDCRGDWFIKWCLVIVQLDAQIPFSVFIYLFIVL